MSFYSLNRAAFNGGVSSIVAGAALVLAVGSTSAAGIRNTYAIAPITSTSQTTGLGLRTAAGDGGFIVGSAVSAFPALLQLQSANIYSLGELRATPTAAWVNSVVSSQVTGFITRPGAGTSFATGQVVSTSLVTLGFASNISGYSTATADASVKLNGQTTWQRDGYSSNFGTSKLIGLGLKTALGYAVSTTQSTCTTGSIKIHGGSAVVQGTCFMAIVASTDAALIQGSSALRAQPLVTVSGTSRFTGVSSLTAEHTTTTFATDTLITVEAVLSADSRIALLGTGLITSSSGLLGTGTITTFATAEVICSASGSAQWSILISASTDIRARVVMTVVPYTNAEALDPDHRTMFRSPVDRTMLRPFTDREMRRLV